MALYVTNKKQKMKKLITPLLIITLFSCKKESQRPLVTDFNPPYLGTYYSTNGDTAYVSKTEDTTMVFIRWCAVGDQAKINFDSVKVFQNGTITCNEYVQYCINQRAIGTGTIGENKLKFTFSLTGMGCSGDAIFNGVK